MGIRKTTGMARRFSALIAGFAISLAGAPLAFAQGLPGEPPPGDSQDIRSIESAEAVKFAYDWAQYGKEPDTTKLIDTTIAVITVAYPPAGIVLGVAKGIITAASAGPDPIGAAIAQINTQLVALNGRVDNLQKQVDGLKDFSFRTANNSRLRELKRRKEVIEGIRDDLRARPTDPAARSKLARDAMRVADRFLDRGSDEADLWDWSDRLRVYSDPEHVGQLKGELLPPRFKPLPTFEYYMSALALAMVAIEYEANGNQNMVIQNYGSALLRHASFLSVRPYWSELTEPASFDHLPERLMQGISCSSGPVSKYPDRAGTCSFSSSCEDTFAQRRWLANAGDYVLNAQDPNTLCTLPARDQRGLTAEQRDAARQPANLLYGENAMRSIENQYTRVDAQEEQIESAWGVDAMTLFADQLVKLAKNGTVREQYVGRFDYTTWKKEFLYAVKPNGDLVWYAHQFGIDRNPPKPGVRDSATATKKFGAVAAAAAATATVNDSVSAQGRRGSRQAISEAIDSSAVVQAVSGRQSAAARVMAQNPRAAALVAATPPAPTIYHRWEGPVQVGNGWQGFREIIPAWYGPTDGSGTAYGFSLYGLMPNGQLKWYRHDGFATGTKNWKGAVDVGTGWNSFASIIAMGDGVLYGIGQDGSLRWYRHGDVANASVRPSWAGPSVVGNGWNGFVRVFGGGQGVIYAVKPDGTLLWYRHTGYLTGQATWEGPKVVGSGWQNFSKVFSPGEGIIYALKPTGEMLWYQHDGYLDGTSRWQVSAQVASEWNVFGNVFPLMWGAPASPIVR